MLELSGIVDSMLQHERCTARRHAYRVARATDGSALENRRSTSHSRCLDLPNIFQVLAALTLSEMVAKTKLTTSRWAFYPNELELNCNGVHNRSTSQSHYRSRSRGSIREGCSVQGNSDWIKEEKFLEYLSFHDWQSVRRDHHAFVAEYNANSIGELDPASAKENPKTIQQTTSQAVLLATLALWLRQPTNVCYRVVLHALPWDVPGKKKKVNLIQQSETQTPIYCHPKDVKDRIAEQHVRKAAELHHVLCSIPRDNPVWVAMRALWAGLTSYSADFRYTLFWIGLEALFGAEDNVGEIGFRLAQRVGIFLGRDPDEARDLYRKTKKCYSVRSKIVHGRWKNDKEIDERMAETEAIFRTSFRRLIDSPDLLRTFISKQRDKFLDDWVFSRSTDPPFPK